MRYVECRFVSTKNPRESQADLLKAPWCIKVARAWDASKRAVQKVERQILRLHKLFFVLPHELHGNCVGGEI